MLDKTRKIIYIITGTLTIISLVFMLMHKVGLCASGGSSNTQSNYYQSDKVPIPYGLNFGYDFDFTFDDTFFNRVTTFVSQNFYDRHPNDIFLLVLEEVDTQGTFFDFIAIDYRYTDTSRTSISVSNDTYVRLSQIYRYKIRYTFSTDSFSINSGSGTSSTFDLLISRFLQENPAFPTSGLEYVYTRGINYLYAPLYVKNAGSLYNSSDEPMIVPVVFDDSGESDFTESNFPEYSDLPDAPSSGDTDYNLYQWLNGQNKNNYDYTKSIFDLIKGFFTWLTSSDFEGFLFCSQSKQQELLEASQVYQDVQSLKGIGQNIFGVLGANASDHVYWTFDFSGTVLDNCGVVQIDFDWYDSIRNYVVPLFLAFFYVGMLLLIIRKIPGIISGASSNSDDK